MCPSTHDPLSIHFISSLNCFPEMSLVCGSIMETIFEENFPNTKVAVDYIEFRLLEVSNPFGTNA